MGPEGATLLVISLLAIFIAIGIPLAFATFATAIISGMTLFGFKSVLLIANRIYDASTGYILIAVPLFIMMGVLMEKGGIAAQLFRVLHIWSARLPGGMAVGCVFAGAVMAAMVGIVGAEIITLGLVALPALLARGYDKKLTLGVICASGSLGAMIPPSLVLVFYGLIAGESIAQLFAAALIPGVLMAISYATYIVIRASLQPELAPPPAQEELDMPLIEKIALVRSLALPALIILGVLGSIYFGIAAPTEAAAIGVAGALLAVIVTGSFRWRDLHDTVIQTGRAVGPVLWVYFGANSLISIYSLSGGVRYLTGLIHAVPLPPLGVLAVIVLILFLLGMVMDWIGIAILTMPVFLPVVEALGYDPVWFGVIFCISMQIAYLTPPIGASAFYLKSVAPPDVSLGEIFTSIWPFVGLQFVILVIVIAFPDLALWLPAQMR
ncbi:TRAP transporter large permease [Acuticoccus kandeliae]|uniref:TRAP transporter large permease n=1 Tax=Acuticoccus kandeliae TaxID=2073160 RepID=UPI000D3E46E4|nr:TRAP transporter large permease subunit [Acuticoccus kandeliae]